MKLLFLSTGINYGGAYKIFVWLANQLVSAGNDVTLLTYRKDKKVIHQEIDTRIRLLHLPLESKRASIVGCLRSVKLLRQHIKAESYHVGVAFLPPSQIRLILACKGTATKSLISQRGDPWSAQVTKSKIVPSRLVNKILLYADSYVFQTVQSQSYYPASVQRRSIVIPNPALTLPRTSDRNPENRIVNVARLVIKQKRQDVLIQAFSLLSPKYPNFYLEFYGSGEDELKLKAMAKGNENIRFMGITSNFVESIQNVTMFVLSSDYEGIPNVLIEAMSLGVPCISTDYSPGGVKLLIEDGENGLLTYPGNVTSLANAIERFIVDKSFAELCGKKGQQVNITFSEEENFQKWLNFIQTII